MSSFKKLQLYLPVFATTACLYIAWNYGIENNVKTIMGIAVSQFLICELPTWEWKHPPSD